MASSLLRAYRGWMSRVRTPKRMAIVLASTAVLTVGAMGAAAAIDGDDDAQERPIPAGDYEQAEQAALQETGGGRVSSTEVEDEKDDNMYEVEVTLDDGSQVEVELDAAFEVVGTENDGMPESDDD